MSEAACMPIHAVADAVEIARAREARRRRAWVQDCAAAVWAKTDERKRMDEALKEAGEA